MDSKIDSCRYGDFAAEISRLTAQVDELRDENAALRSKLDELSKSVDYICTTDLATLKRKTLAVMYAVGVLDENEVSYYTGEEWASLLSEFNLTPNCVLMPREAEDVDRQLYEETVHRGFLTTTDVMRMLSYSRPGALRAMQRTSEIHTDLVLAKRKTRNNSARRVWILEHVEHMSTVAINGFGFA